MENARGEREREAKMPCGGRKITNEASKRDDELRKEVNERTPLWRTEEIKHDARFLKGKSTRIDERQGKKSFHGTGTSQINMAERKNNKKNKNP